MNKVLFRTEELPMPPWKKEAENFICRVLEILEQKNWELSVLLCSNGFIRSLNARYRNKDEPTDVLAFPMGINTPGGKYIAGDIVISLDALDENARFFKVSGENEFRRLLVHGILHLSGYDHSTNKSEEPMLKTQEEILARLAEKIT